MNLLSTPWATPIPVHIITTSRKRQKTYTTLNHHAHAILRPKVHKRFNSQFAISQRRVDVRGPTSFALEKENLQQTQASIQMVDMNVKNCVRLHPNRAGPCLTDVRSHQMYKPCLAIPTHPFQSSQ